MLSAWNSKIYISNSCSISAVAAHLKVPSSSVLANISITTNTNRKIGHTVCVIALKQGFYIYQNQGSIWIKEPFTTYNKKELVQGIMNQFLYEGETIKDYTFDLIN